MADETTTTEPIAQQILDDGGYGSRKYLALYVYFLLMTGAFLCGVNWTGTAAAAARAASVASVLPTYGGLTGAALAAYYGVNWGYSFIAHRNAVAAGETEPAK